jgi:hypothetical protein
MRVTGRFPGLVVGFEKRALAGFDLMPAIGYFSYDGWARLYEGDELKDN